jgi:branched-chain amino acid transport system permease protein
MADLVSAATFVAIYGLSYGVILFLISVGLVVTMGLMRVVNMAHGVFAAAGGYLSVQMINAWGLSFGVAVALAVVASAAASLIVERVFFRRLYGAPELEQALLTIGLAFIGIATINLAFGPDVFAARLPALLARNVEVLGRSVQAYRIFIIVLGVVVMALLFYLFDKTAFGARLRAAVDNRGMAESVGINVRGLFSAGFVLGSALAALGGAVGVAILPLEPVYPLKYLILILIVVVLSGNGNMKITALVSIVIGVIDTAGRYFYPEAGSFLIYVVVLVYLLARRDAGALAAAR